MEGEKQRSNEVARNSTRRGWMVRLMVSSIGKHSGGTTPRGSFLTLSEHLIEFGSQRHRNQVLVNITIAKPEIGPFCVLELRFRRAAFCFKSLKTRDLSSLANKMHKQ